MPMSKEYYIKKLKEKFATDEEFNDYQQRLVTEGNRASFDEDLDHWNELDWFVWDNNVEEIYCE